MPNNSVVLTETQTELLASWEQAKINAVFWRDKEMELRKLVAHGGITSAEEGTNTAAIGNGYKLKVAIKINYKVETDYKKVEKVLSRLPADIAERLIKWTPALSLTEYRNLDERQLKIVNEVVTTDEAAPTVEIVAPKTPR